MLAIGAGLVRTASSPLALAADAPVRAGITPFDSRRGRGRTCRRRQKGIIVNLTRLLALAGVVLAAIAFLAAVIASFAAPAWVLPAAVLCVAVAVAL